MDISIYLTSPQILGNTEISLGFGESVFRLELMTFEISYDWKSRI